MMLGGMSQTYQIQFKCFHLLGKPSNFLQINISDGQSEEHLKKKITNFV